MTSKQVWTCVLAGPCAAMSAFWLIFFSDKSDSAFDKLICHCLSCRGLPIKGKKLNPSFSCFYIGFPCFPRQNVFIFPGFSFVHSHELWSFRLCLDACFTEGNPPPDHASLNESMFWAGLIVDSNNSQDCPVDWLTCFGLDHPNPVFFQTGLKCVCVCVILCLLDSTETKSGFLCVIIYSCERLCVVFSGQLINIWDAAVPAAVI